MRVAPALVLAALSLALAVPAASAASKKSSAKSAASGGKSAAKSAKRSAGKAAAAATAAREPAGPTLSPLQMEIANQVQTGTADCEFDQTVSVQPHLTQPGHFRVRYRSTTYTMVPEETSTGAVRLHDAKAGVTWLQIPVKSMLMNAPAATGWGTPAPATATPAR
ncbi:hypothetical protein ABXN37_15720 [Piscinibacter sakaiensis]|uniref:hypothetical protein n=1 Tax=Piscinibacter sakaiensis TaxID=1547922 RepID=UPI003726E13A